jgi:zinc transport system ATP-binding protein
MTHTSNCVVQLEGVSIAFGPVPVLENINLTINQGDFIGIVGPNGSGKTTLLRIILGLIQPDCGTARILGKPPAKSRVDIGYVPQFIDFDRKFPISVLDAVMMGRLSSEPLLGPFKRESREAAIAALGRVKAEDLAKRRIGHLSGGQLQRVLLARAMVDNPKILLLDEPTANIDCRAEYDFFEMLHELNDNITIAMVSHDLGFISSHVTRIACVNRTLVCHPAQQITPEILAQLYGHSIDMIAHHMHSETE